MTQDTRKDRRVKIVSLNVRYKSATVDEFIENHAHDVSRGGIFIKTANPFPPGTLLKFEIRLASDQAVIAGVGRIVWKRDAGASNGEHPAGMGVKFIKIDDPSKVVIDRLVNTRSDAGKAFEGNEEAMGQSDRPPVRTAPPPRPPAHAATAPPPPAAAPRASGSGSMSPAAETPAIARAAGPQHISTPAGTPHARKQTMMGIGISTAPTTPSAPPGAVSSPPPAMRTPFPVARSLPPRPGTASPMFPKSASESDYPPKQEQTVMKQAAELLEEALREAGGSMEDVGTNPLFSGSAESATPSAPAPKSPITPASEWTTADTPQALAATAAAKRAEEAAAREQSQRTRSDSPRSSRETPTSVRPAAAAARASDRAATTKKGGGAFIIVCVAAAAVLVVVVMFRDQLFDGGAPQEPVATPSATPIVTPIATAPVVASAPSTAAAPSGANEPPAPSATLQPPTIAPATGVATGHPSAEVTSATPIAPPPPRPPKPLARPAAPPPPTPPSATATATENATAAPAPAETATAAPPSAKPPAAPPKPKPTKPADDNPY
jgi:uncharacterized protein (TIGR02266 family)